MKKLWLFENNWFRKFNLWLWNPFRNYPNFEIHLGVKHENVELNQKGNNQWNRTNNRINEMLGH